MMGKRHDKSSYEHGAVIKHVDGQFRLISTLYKFLFNNIYIGYLIPNMTICTVKLIEI